MYDNYNYPAGSDNEHAPWNQRVLEERSFNVHVTTVVELDTLVHTDDYVPECVDEDGTTRIDTSDTDWKQAYKDDCITLEDLLHELKAYVVKELPSVDNEHTRRGRYLKRILRTCQSMNVTETYVEEL